MNMTVREFLSYALEDWYKCKVYSFKTDSIVLDGIIADVLDSEYVDHEIDSFDIGDDGAFCVNIDAENLI